MHLRDSSYQNQRQYFTVLPYTGLSNEMWYNRAIWLSRHVLDIVFHLDATNESLFQHLQNLGPDIWLTCLRAHCAYTEKSFSHMAC